MATERCGDIEKARSLLSTVKGSILDICGEIYDIMEQSERGGRLLRFFCEDYERIESDESVAANVLFEEGEKEKYVKKYGKLVDGILEKTIRDQLPAADFYDALWETICSDILFKDKKTKTFAIYYIWIDVRIPYFEVFDGMRIEKEEYKALVRELIPYIQKVRFVSFGEYEQKTERSSLLLKILDEVQGEKRRAVLMAAILQMRDKMVIANMERNAQRRLEERHGDATDD